MQNTSCRASQEGTRIGQKKGSYRGFGRGIRQTWFGVLTVLVMFSFEHVEGLSKTCFYYGNGYEYTIETHYYDMCPLFIEVENESPKTTE